MSVARNYLYNVLLQISNILIPFITTPYITRVLDPSGFGIVSFANSIIQYFILFGTLGLNLYGNRLIAYVRDDEDKLSKTFWELLWLRTITLSVAAVIYVIFLFTIRPTFLSVYLIQLMNLLATALDISFLFMGVEDFKTVSLRGFTARLITAGLIFILVHNRNDFIIYATIGAFGNLLSQLIVWRYLFRYVPRRTKTFLHDLFKHLPGTIKLFVPLIAIQVYTILDRTMLGVLSSEDQVGIYTAGTNLVKMALSLVTSIGTVMLTKMSNLVAKNERKLMENYAQKIFDFVTYASFIVTLGLFFLSKDFVSIFFGKEFQSVLYVIKTVCPIIIFVSWSNFFGMQLMVPMQHERDFTLSVLTGAVTNFSLNLFFIPRYGAIGASIATVIAEFGVTFSQMIFMRKVINVPGLLKCSWKHFTSVAGTSVILLLISRWISFQGVLISFAFKGILLIVLYIFFEKLLKSEINDFVLQKVMLILKKNKEKITS